MRGGNPAGTRRAGTKVSPRSELINDFTPNANLANRIRRGGIEEG